MNVKRMVSLLVVSLLTFSSCWVFGAEKLSGVIAYNMRHIGPRLDKAEKLLDQGDKHNAQASYDTAKQSWDAIHKDFKGQFDVNHPEIVSMQKRFDAVGARLKGGAAKPAPTPAPTLASAADRAPPATMLYLMKQIHGNLDKAEQLLGRGDALNAASNFNSAKMRWDAIQKDYKGKFDPNHPDVAAMRKRYNAVGAKLSAAGAAKLQGPATTPPSGAGASATKTPTPAAASAKKLPYPTRTIVNSIKRLFNGIEKNFSDTFVPDTRALRKGQTGLHLRKGQLGRIDSKIADIEKLIPRAHAKAAEEGVADHPALTGLEQQLSDVRARLAQERKQLEKEFASAKATAGKIKTDAAALKKESDRLFDQYFRHARGNAIYYSDLEPVEKTLQIIERFEKEEQKKAEETLAAFSAKYGANKREIEAKTGSIPAGYAFQKMREGIDNIAKTRVTMGEDLAGKVQMKIDNFPGLSDFYRVRQHNEIRKWVEMAKRFSPENAKVREMSGSIKQKLADDLKAYKAKVDKQEWRGNSTDANAKAGLKFFNESEDWAQRPKDKDPQRPLGIAITGDWSIQKRDALGKPTMYGIPALIAVQLDSEKAIGLARVYSVTLRTIESPNPKTKPPFTSISVGSSYYIKASKIK